MTSLCSRIATRRIFLPVVRSTLLLITCSMLLIIAEFPRDASGADLEQLLQAARSDTASERLNAAKQLEFTFYGHNSEDAKRTAVKELIALLRDKQWFVRLAAADSLKSSREPKTVPDLVHALAVEQNDTVREHVTSTIEGIRSSLEYQLWEFQDPDPAKRQEALTRWAYSSDAKFKAAVIGCLHDPVDSIRMSAAATLVEQNNPAVIDFEIDILEHSDNDLKKQNAAYSLGKLHASKAADPLFRALSHSPGLRYNAGMALGEIGDPRAVDALISSLGSGWTGIAKLLVKFGEPAESALIVALHNSDQGTRVYAALALSLFKDARSVEALTSALHDSDSSVRRAAEEALARMKNDTAH